MRIEDYAIIGDMHTVALVGINGSIDWLCLPKFGSDACFASLLGIDGNGFWKISTADPRPEVKRRYVDDTLVLETEFETHEGKARLVDFMPIGSKQREIIRIVEGIAGKIDMQMRLVIRFDYGKTVPWVRSGDDGGIVAIAGPNALTLRTGVQLRGEDLSTVGDFCISAGQSESFVLTWHASNEEFVRQCTPVSADLEKTRNFWTDWVARCKYKGPWREPLVRSLITLKALTYEPTGGIMAAATTSLPEFIGGVRNWDYRFCWLRDATFTLYSFMTAGYFEEARAWSNWLLRAVAGDPSQLQIMYGAAGERTLTELNVPHLIGYEKSSPVRIGNAASEQFQLDIFGEVMDAMNLARAGGIHTDEDSWKLQKHLIQFVVDHWRDPDEGIWEIRGPRRHFTHSKVMAWVAMDRAVKAVEQFQLQGDGEKWAKIRAEIHEDICRNGFHSARKAFTQYYGALELDASVLMLPLVGFLPATDPRMVSTIELIERELVAEGFVLRYKTSPTGHVDGLPPGEGSFLPCSFWLADCLYLMGRLDDARALYEKLLAVRNDVGLLAEEYDPAARRQLGNFPQAFSHVSLVNTAYNLNPQTIGPAEKRSAS